MAATVGIGKASSEPNTSWSSAPKSATRSVPPSRPAVSAIIAMLTPPLKKRGDPHRSSTWTPSGSSPSRCTSALSSWSSSAPSALAGGVSSTAVRTEPSREVVSTSLPGGRGSGDGLTRWLSTSRLVDKVGVWSVHCQGADHGPTALVTHPMTSSIASAPVERRRLLGDERLDAVTVIL